MVNTIVTNINVNKRLLLISGARDSQWYPRETSPRASKHAKNRGIQGFPGGRGLLREGGDRSSYRLSQRFYRG